MLRVGQQVVWKVADGKATHMFEGSVVGVSPRGCAIQFTELGQITVLHGDGKLEPQRVEVGDTVLVENRYVSAEGTVEQISDADDFQYGIRFSNGDLLFLSRTEFQLRLPMFLTKQAE